MNKEKKLIWTAYLIILVYFFFFDTSYDQGDHIFMFIVFGWIPFLIMSLIWKGKSKVEVTANSDPVVNIHPDLNKIIELEKIQDLLGLEKIATDKINEITTELDTLLQELHKNPDFLQNADWEELAQIEADKLEKLFELDDTLKELRLDLDFTKEFIKIADNANNNLLAGSLLKESKDMFDKELGNITSIREEAKAKLVASKIMSESLIEAKKSGKDTIDTDEVIKKFNREIDKRTKKTSTK